MTTAAVVAWTALYDLAESLTATTLDGVQVVEGPLADQEPGQDLLIIGQSDGTSPAIITEADIHVDACTGRREEGDIVCVASSFAGDPQVRPRLERCQQIVAALDAALKAEPGIGGLLDGAWIGTDAEWIPSQVSEGVIFQVGFTVHYVAEI